MYKYISIYDAKCLLFVCPQVKVLKKPRFELSKLLELHGDGGKGTSGEGGEGGSKVDRPEGYEPPVQESV